MKNILIATMPEDIHALYVQLSLKKKGHPCTLWYTSDFPTQQQHSFRMRNSRLHWQAYGNHLQIDHDPFDVVWYRRPRHPVADDLLHPDDQKNAARENLAFYHTFWEIIAPHARWINPPASAHAANCKLLQLKTANASGFHVPETLISNAPSEIRSFICENKPGEVIYKSLYPLSWRNKNDFRMLYTHPVRLHDLPSDDILQRSAGIFQKRVTKAFELRITCMGTQLIAAKIDSKSHARGENDWRFIPPTELHVTAFELPDAIQRTCRTFMKKMGLLFGCIDIIVTPDNEYYFLEVNEQGQFLWIENACPDIKMLDAFVQFLADENKTERKHIYTSHAMATFEKEVENLFHVAIRSHVRPPQ